MAAPGMTLEERQRAMRVGGRSEFSALKAAADPGRGGGSSGNTITSPFALVEEEMLIERLLACDSSVDFFRQPPFSLSKSASMKVIDAAFRKAGRIVHPDRCKHPKATEAFQRLAHFRATGLAALDPVQSVAKLRRDTCEECGKVAERAESLFKCQACGRLACHACNFGLTDKSAGKARGGVGDGQHCFACVWLQEDGMVF
jgi:hypothetical protein